VRGARQTLGFMLANWPKLVVLGLAITLVVLVSKNGLSFFGKLFNWFAKPAHRGWGFMFGVFVPFFTLAIALWVPAVVFIMAAGFLFGFWRALLACWIGGAVGQALAFLLARYLLREWVQSFIASKWKRWRYIDKAIEAEGWKLVLVLRLSPAIPYNLLNIACGAASSIHFWSFALVSAVGIVFEVGVFAWVGATADSITAVISRVAGPPKTVQWVLLGLSITMCAAAAVGVGVMVRLGCFLFSLSPSLSRRRLVAWRLHGHKLARCGKHGAVLMMLCCSPLAYRRAIKRAEEAEAGSSGQFEALAPEGEPGSLPSSPRALEREGFVSSIAGYGRPPEGRGSFFELKLVAPPAAPPERPPSRAAKAKSSPRAADGGPRTPFATKPAQEAGQRDLELGMSASRRRASRADSDDE
jgi:uncharacterized membrane protein YdjX (TVP38/TMEM64 family)